MADGSVIKVITYEAHTGKLVAGKLAAFMERILARDREDEPAQPRWKVGWLLGMVGADVEVLEADGKHKRYGDWRHSPDADNDEDRKEMKEALQKIKEPSFKTHGCSACEHGATQQNKGQHSTTCRQVVHASGVAPSVWKVKYDSEGCHVREPETGRRSHRPRR